MGAVPSRLWRNDSGRTHAHRHAGRWSAVTLWLAIELVGPGVARASEKVQSPEPSVEAIARSLDLRATNCTDQDFSLNRLRSDIALELWSSGVQARHQPVRIELRCLSEALEILLSYRDTRPPLSLKRPRGEGNSPRSRERAYALVIAELTELRFEAAEKAPQQGTAKTTGAARDDAGAQATTPKEVGEGGQKRPETAAPRSEVEIQVDQAQTSPVKIATRKRRPRKKKTKPNRARKNQIRAQAQPRTRRPRSPWTRENAIDVHSRARIRSLDLRPAGGFALSLGLGPSWQNKQLSIALRPQIAGEWSGSRRAQARADMGFVSAGGELSFGLRLNQALQLELQLAGMAHLVWIRGRLEASSTGQTTSIFGASGQWQLGLGLSPTPDRPHGPTFGAEFGYAIPYPRGDFVEQEGGSFAESFSPGQFYVGLGFGWRFRL